MKSNKQEKMEKKPSETSGVLQVLRKITTFGFDIWPQHSKYPAIAQG